MTWDSFWTTTNTILEEWKIIRIAFIVLFAFLARWVMLVAIRRVVTQIVSGVKRTQNVEDTQSLNVSPVAAVRTVQRTRTLGSVLTNIVNVLVAVIAILLIVTVIDENILTSFALLTAALGAGLGFGAQNIVKDVLNGLFMVMEDQLGVGDVVDLGPATGVVEAVGIRITQVRDVNGTLWFVRNGEILRVGNMSHGWARVIIDLAVPYKTDVDAVQSEMLRVAVEMATSSKWRSRVIEKPEIWGLESISDEAIVIRIVIKTRTTAKDDVARELRLRLKKALDAMGVQLPSLSSIVLTGFEGAASVQGARPPRTTPLPVIAPPAKKAPRKTRAQKAAEALGAANAKVPAPAPAPERPAAPRATKTPGASTGQPSAAGDTSTQSPAAPGAAGRPTRMPSIARNQAPRAPRTVHLPIQDGSPAFSDAPTDPTAELHTAPDPAPTTKPAAKQAKPRTRPIDKPDQARPDQPTARDGDTDD
ncbi:mechanosensitive ion channel family protein [Cryobacterium sp. PAMC25264]|uniref:mechanosensitive ion channel family protein n=1 Tax=Cryobacterium sp. PAMC25264 TaxID=2861288 RepID=UPI001C6297B8|nr:mechanosensitive ion channel family protein [Cryobacterium sp. PAMC25264]QYF75080.1 mechanosensitive ion channel [Cryobacterium sp. PAMC25264]